MNLIKHTENDQIILMLSGRLDTTTAPEFQTVLLSELQNGTDVILDFQDLAYVSSAGLRVLLTGQKAVASTGQHMILRHVVPSVMEVFDMTGFSDILTIQPE